MPHLRYCNRFWHVAGDELALPALCSISGRIFWTALIAVVYGVSYKNLSTCFEDGWVLQTYLIFSMVLFILEIIAEALVIMVSLKGSITQPEERSDLAKYVTFKLILTFGQIACSIFGILTLSLGGLIPCDSEVFNSRLAQGFIWLVVISQLIDAGVLFCCCYCLSFEYSHNKQEANETTQQFLERAYSEGHEEDNEAIVTIWENRCRQFTRSIHYLCCNAFGGGNIEDGFNQVAKVLTYFFHHDGMLDVVPSDVVAGIILVRLEQKHNKIKLEIRPDEYQKMRSLIIQNSSRKGYDEDDIESGSRVHCPMRSYQTPPNNNNTNTDAKIEDVHVITPDHHDICPITIEEIECWQRGMVFALAVYSHLLAIYMHPFTGVCRLCCQCTPNNTNTCSSCLNISSPQNITQQELREVLIEGDNCCRLNRAGVTLFSALLQNTELLYVSFKNDTRNKPYGIFLDHEKEWVVIAIRGTLSLEDCITDVTCEPEEMSEAGAIWGFDGSNKYAHGGMLRAAMHIRGELQRNGLLHRLLGRQSPPNSNANFNTPLNESHSKYIHYKLVVTGHSLGAGTAALLSWLLKAEFPNVRCFTFGTPASVVDKESALAMQSYCTSIILGNDLVCRLNFQALCSLRDNILDCIGRAKVNKMIIMKSMFRATDPNTLMHPKGSEPNSDFKKSIDHFKKQINKRLTKYEGLELCLPGRIVHFVKVDTLEKSCCANQKLYIPVIRKAEDFNTIFMSSSMGADHFPDQYYYEILKVKKSFENIDVHGIMHV